MARVAIALVLLVATTKAAHAQSSGDVEVGTPLQCRKDLGCTERPDLVDDVQAVAAEAGVDPIDLLGAVNTTQLAPRTYLCLADQLLCPPEPTPAAPAPSISSGLSARLYCIEEYESHHNGGAVNRSSGARGWLQWLPSTARQWGVIIGNRQSEWAAAARIAAQGERFFRSQWVPLQLGLC